MAQQRKSTSKNSRAQAPSLINQYNRRQHERVGAALSLERALARCRRVLGSDVAARLARILAPEAGEGGAT